MLGVIKVIAGLVLPIRLTGRLYLANRLAWYGVPKEYVPNACLQELADDTIAESKNIAALMREPWRSRVTEHLDGKAVHIATILKGTYDFAGPGEDQGREIERKLQKHGLNVAGPHSRL